MERQLRLEIATRCLFPRLLPNNRFQNRMRVNTHDNNIASALIQLILESGSKALHFHTIMSNEVEELDEVYPHTIL